MASQASWFARRLPNLHARYQSTASGRVGKTAAFTWKHRRAVLFGLGITYFGVGYSIVWLEARQRDFVHDNTYLFWRIYPGSIVEVRGPPSLSHLAVAPSAGEDPPRTMELWEAIKALKLAAVDPRIRGVFADFSTLSWPSSRQSEGLGLAQIEELVQAIHDFKVAKDVQFPPPAPAAAVTDGKAEDSSDSQAVAPQSPQPSSQPPYLPSTVAFADTFLSQSSYLLASAFEKVYLQPSGSLPLVGVSAQVPFFSRLLSKLGVKMHSEARREYKSMISQFVEEDGLTKPQAENEAQLLGELNKSVAYAIGVNRFPNMEDPDEAADKVVQLMQQGPFSAKEAEESGLIDGRMYKGEVLNAFFPNRKGAPELSEATTSGAEAGGDMVKKSPTAQTLHFKTLPHYSRVQTSGLDKMLNDDSKINVGVVYLRGSIGSAAGDYTASAAIKGLREAAEDDDVTAIVLRIDSGGGDVVASDSIWHAVRRTREEAGKPVVVSFGNIAASGSYYAATAADAIFASETTITGSIGVASLRPTLKRDPLFEWLGVRVQSFFTGSKAESLLHDLDEGQLERQRKHIDETYDDFLEKVCKGRGITSGEVVEGIAGGRVFTGLAAWSLTSPDSLRPIVAKRRGGSASASVAAAADEVVRRAEEALGLPASSSSSRLESVNFEPSKPLAEWDLEDATRGDELTTTMVRMRRRASSGTQEASNDDDEQQSAGSVASTLSEAASSVASSLSSATTSSSSPQDAQQAHLAASRDAPTPSSSETDIARHAEESLRTTPPYGNGLVDSIGGLWDAASHAMNLGLSREMVVLMQEKGITNVEEAFKLLRPGCERQKVESAALEDGQQQPPAADDASNSQKSSSAATTTVGGDVSLVADVRLLKYPKDRTLFERARELNKRGDAPSLSLSAWAGLLAAETVKSVMGEAVGSWWGRMGPVGMMRSWVVRAEEEARMQGLRGGVRMEYGGLGGEAR